MVLYKTDPIATIEETRDRVRLLGTMRLHILAFPRLKVRLYVVGQMKTTIKVSPTFYTMASYIIKQTVSLCPNQKDTWTMDLLLADDYENSHG